MPDPIDRPKTCDMARVYLFHGDCPCCIYRYQPTEDCPHAQVGERDSGGMLHCRGFRDNSIQRDN